MTKILVKECANCKKSFSISGQNHRYCTPECQEIAYSQKSREWTNRYKVKKPEKQMLRSAKFRAKRRGLPFNITDDDVIIPLVCPILGIPLKVNVLTGPGGRFDSFSLDRIDPKLGYVKGNVQVISHRANSMKGDATANELIAFAKYILNTYKDINV